MRVLPAMQGKNMALLFVFKKSTIIFFYRTPSKPQTNNPAGARL
jgi:hypothetical protein